MLDVIGTCMQIFKKIDLKKKPEFFHSKLSCIVFAADCTVQLPPQQTKLLIYNTKQYEVSEVSLSRCEG